MLKCNKLIFYLYFFFVFVFLLFVYIFILQNIWDSFYEWSIFLSDKVFVGIDNYVYLFKDFVFYQVFKNNIFYVVILIIF